MVFCAGCEGPGGATFFSAGVERAGSASRFEPSRMLSKVRRVPVGLFPSHPAKTLRSRLFTAKTAPNNKGFLRFGVIVPKAVAKSAAQRNHLKRVAYRVLGEISGMRAEDVIVILKPPALVASSAELKEELLSLVLH